MDFLYIPRSSPEILDSSKLPGLLGPSAGRGLRGGRWPHATCPGKELAFKQSRASPCRLPATIIMASVNFLYSNAEFVKGSSEDVKDSMLETWGPTAPQLFVHRGPFLFRFRCWLSMGHAKLR